MPSPNLNSTLSSINKDFADIKKGLIGVVKMQRTEFKEKDAVRRYQANRVSLPTTIKNLNAKENFVSATGKIKSGVSTTAGIFGNLLLFLGAAGLVKILLSTDIGKFFGKFLSSIFNGVIDFFKKSFEIIKDVLMDKEVTKEVLNTIKSIFSFLENLFLTSFDIAAELIKEPEVLKDIRRIFTSVFETMVTVLSSSYEIIKNLFSDNQQDIIKHFNNTFATIADIFSNLIRAVAGSLSAPIIGEKIGDIIKASWELLVEIFTQTWKDPETGRVYNPWVESLKWVSEAVLVILALRRLKLIFLTYVFQKAFEGLGSGCGDMDEYRPKPSDKNKSEKKPRQGPPKRGSKEALERAKEKRQRLVDSTKSKATFFERVKHAAAVKWRKILSLITKIKYSNTVAGRVLSFFSRILYRVAGSKAADIAKTIILRLSSVGTGAVASTIGSATAALFGEILLLVGAIYLMEQIYESFMDNLDGANDEADKAIKEQLKKGIKNQSELELSNFLESRENLEQETEEPIRKIGDYITTSSTPSTSPTPVSSAAPTDALSKVEAYLGRKLDSKEWEYLQRAVYAEGSGNEEEYANIMAVILNRARKSGARIQDILYAENAFQSVTGTKKNQNPSPRFQKGPFNSPKDLQAILNGTNKLEGISKNLDSFTAANTAAYKKGTDISWLEQLKNAGGKQIGGTVFAENMYGSGKGRINLPSSTEMKTQVALQDQEIKQFQDKDKKENSLITTLLSGASSHLMLLNELTGGKLIENSDVFNSSMRELEEAIKNHPAFVDMSKTTVIQNSKQEIKTDSKGVEEKFRSVILAGITDVGVFIK